MKSEDIHLFMAIRSTLSGITGVVVSGPREDGCREVHVVTHPTERKWEGRLRWVRPSNMEPLEGTQP